MSENIIQLITQLNRYTLNRSIVWSRKDPPRSIITGTDSYIPLFFLTRYKGKKIGIYENRYRHFTDIDEYYWDYRVILCILDEYDDDISIWEYDENPSIIHNLFDNIKYQSSGIDTIFGGL